MLPDEFNHLFHPIRDYLNSFEIPEDETQQQMRQQAIKDTLERWIIPIDVGRLFYILALISRAENIYEIGSYLGYSATWFAKAVPEHGKVVLTENNETRFQQASNFFAQSELKSKVELRFCDAHEDLANSEENFDIILIDHDKPHYTLAYQIAKTKISQNGVIIADNVLWRNRIVKPEWQDDPSTLGVIDFNQMIMNDPDMTSLILPIGDGVSISYPKKAPI